ncbi:CorA metal ion transporter [Coemansia sp. RSA 1933]|nr:CorA metal ion transporter [Coemansia sp. RSA 1933]
MLRAHSADNVQPRPTRQQRQQQQQQQQQQQLQVPAAVGTAGPAPKTSVDLDALRQWSGTGKLKRSYAPSHHRKYRLGRWQSRSASSWNPPGNTPISISPMAPGSAREASRSRRSLVSIDISHKPSESRRTSIGSIHSMPPPMHLHGSDMDDDMFDYDSDSDSDGDSNGPLAQLLLRENDEIWNNQAFRFTFYSPNTGTVRANDVRTLRTDDASGLDALIGQALDNSSDKRPSSFSRYAESDAEDSPGLHVAIDNNRKNSDFDVSVPKDSGSRGHAPAPYAVPPQLSVTSADSIAEAEAAAATATTTTTTTDNSGFLHPHYTRTQFSHHKTRPGSSSASSPPDEGSSGSSAPFPKLPNIVTADHAGSPGDSAEEQRPKVFWLDIMNPTSSEITALSRIFNLHPLTTEELLLMRENGISQDNFKSFRHYDVICYRTSMGTPLPPEVSAGGSTTQVGVDASDPTPQGSDEDEKRLREAPTAVEPPVIQGDRVPRGLRSRLGLRKLGGSRKTEAKQGEPAQNQADMQYDFPGSVGDDALDEPAPLYVIVLADGVITLHYHSVPHVRNTVARLKLDEDLVQITPDYIAYLLLDDITDTLVPTTRLLELEVDAIDELVLILTRAEHDDVLKRIGIERRHALWLVRLMHGKAEVLRAIERRVQAKMGLDPSSPSRSGPRRRLQRVANAAAADGGNSAVSGFGDEYDDGDADSDADAIESQLLTSDEEEGDLYEWARRTDDADNRRGAQARDDDGSGKQPLVPDVTKYLADVHDHLIALTASVHHCERILARAHGNYLARINLELTHASNTTNQLATQMTVLAGIFLPLNLVAGIFGMNVKVPGRDRDDLRDFGLILGAMAIFVVVALAICRWRRII